MVSFPQFVREFCDGRLELPIADACRLAGINYHTLKNARFDPGRRPLLAATTRSNRLFVAAAELYRYFAENPASGMGEAEATPVAASRSRGRGRPRKEGV